MFRALGREFLSFVSRLIADHLNWDVCVISSVCPVHMWFEDALFLWLVWFSDTCISSSYHPEWEPSWEVMPMNSLTVLALWWRSRPVTLGCFAVWLMMAITLKGYEYGYLAFLSRIMWRCKVFSKLLCLLFSHRQSRNFQLKRSPLVDL